MNNVKSMNWAAFKDALLAHPDLDLQFQYASNKLVDASFHITEIKQAPIVSVDCGGVMNSWLKKHSILLILLKNHCLLIL
jgi:hypothetical protein